MYLNLTEAGKRIGKSRTIIGKLIDKGFLNAYINPDSGRREVLESDIADYAASYKLYKNPQEPHVSQPLQNNG